MAHDLPALRISTDRTAIATPWTVWSWSGAGRGGGAVRCPMPVVALALSWRRVFPYHNILGGSAPCAGFPSSRRFDIQNEHPGVRAAGWRGEGCGELGQDVPMPAVRVVGRNMMFPLGHRLHCSELPESRLEAAGCRWMLDAAGAATLAALRWTRGLLYHHSPITT